jgi:hypothetical protein
MGCVPLLSLKDDNLYVNYKYDTGTMKYSKSVHTWISTAAATAACRDIVNKVRP